MEQIEEEKRRKEEEEKEEEERRGKGEMARSHTRRWVRVQIPLPEDFPMVTVT